MFRNISILTLPIFAILTACGPAPVETPTVNLIPSTATPMALNESSCQSISLEPTPDAKTSSLFPPVSESDQVKGPADAAMTIIEYGDFQ